MSSDSFPDGTTESPSAQLPISSAIARVQPSSSISSTLLALILISRPLGWIAALTLQRIGMTYAHVEDTPVTLGLSIALTFPFCLYLFGLNDLADEASDRANPRKGNWIHGASKGVSNRFLAKVSPWIGGLGVATFIPMLPFRAGVLLAAILAVSWAYSSKPLRLKEVPIVDGLVTASIMIGLVGVGFWSGGMTEALPFETFAVAPTLAGLHIFASVVDVDSDHLAGHRTLAVRLGARQAGAVALGLSLLTAASVPFLDYALPIATYVVVQPCIIAGWMFMPRWFTARRSISVVGLVGLLTLIVFSMVRIGGG